MLPQNIISSPAVPAAFLAPDSSALAVLTDYEQGGIAIGNAGRGRQYQDWSCFVGGSTVYVAPSSNLSSATAILTAPAITSVSLAFDSNMNVAVAYTSSNLLYLYWYDTGAGAYVTTPFSGASSGLVSTDDKRESQEGGSDVLFAYIQGDNLYYRQQRDRYGVAYLVGPAASLKLTRIGMNALNRFQFELLPVTAP